MSDSGPPGGDPFGGIPFLGELARMFGGAAGGGDAARQLARTIATEGASEGNVDPADRMAVEELARVAELQVADATGLPPGRGGVVRVEVVNRTGWADRTIADYRPLFEELAGSMTGALGVPDDVPADDPMAAMMAGLSRMLGPVMAQMTTGSMVGHLARRSLGGLDLPVPRPPSSPLLVCLPNVDGFGRDWSLGRDDLRLWVCLHEITTATVLGVPHVRERLTELLTAHARAFERDPQALEERLGGLDLSAGPEALAELQSTLGDPEAVLGAVRSAEQEALQPRLTAVVAVVTGYVDHVMERIGSSLIGDYAMVTEALHRRRVEADASDRFVEKILGLELDRDHYERARAFVEGVVERAGEEALGRLWVDAEGLPTPAEVDAPGLWLARIDLDAG